MKDTERLGEERGIGNYRIKRIERRGEIEKGQRFYALLTIISICLHSAI